MTHTARIPQNDWNFGRNGADKYIKELLKRWPTDAYFSGAGKDIITGNRELPGNRHRNPVRAAYEFWPGNALKNGRSSWDQVAVLFAVRPEYFSVEQGCLWQNEDMETFWTAAVDSCLTNHFKVVLCIPKDTLENTIETLMAENPR